jgi:hypothetical protein
VSIWNVRASLSNLSTQSNVPLYSSSGILGNQMLQKPIELFFVVVREATMSRVNVQKENAKMRCLWGILCWCVLNCNAYSPKSCWKNTNPSRLIYCIFSAYMCYCHLVSHWRFTPVLVLNLWNEAREATAVKILVSVRLAVVCRAFLMLSPCISTNVRISCYLQHMYSVSMV